MLRTVLAGALGAALALAGGAAGPRPADVAGTYRLHGTARVSAPPALDRGVELHADVVLAPGPRAREVRVRLSSGGYACDLVATLGDAGALRFDDGQRCDVAVEDPGARGRLEARVRSGRGQVRDGRLALDLAGELEGVLSLRTAGLRVLGAELPPTWTPELPVRGDARASAEGDLDRSRAAPEPGR